MTYGDFKGLKRRTAADNVLREKAFNVTKNLLYIFDKKAKGSGVTLANKSIPQNKQLAEELHKLIFRKFKKRGVYSAVKDNI